MGRICPIRALINSTHNLTKEIENMKRLVIALAICVGIGLGSIAFAACYESFSYPVPCQNITGFRCPSGCATTITPTTRSNCVGVTDGCCQWLVATFQCSGGSCGSSCTTYRDNMEFSHYRAMWHCCTLANGIDRVCKPACSDPDEL
jgi:hypothetical protein